MPEEGDMPPSASGKGSPEGDQRSVSEEIFEEEQQALVADHDADGGDNPEAGEPTQQSTRKRNLIIGTIAALVVIVAVVGATTGVLLSKDTSKSTSSTESFANESITASPVSSPTMDTTTAAPSLSCDDLLANATEQIYYVSFEGNISDVAEDFLTRAFLNAYSSLGKDDGCSPVVSQIKGRRWLQEDDNSTDTSTPAPVPPTITRIGFAVTAAQTPAQELLVLEEDFVTALNENLAEADIVAESIQPEATSLPTMAPFAANISNTLFPTTLPSSDMNITNTSAPTMSPSLVMNFTNTTDSTVPTMAPTNCLGNNCANNTPVIGTASPTAPFITLSTNTTLPDLPIPPSVPCLQDVACGFVMAAIDPVLPPSTRALVNVPGTCQNYAREWLRTGEDVIEFPVHRVRQRFALAVLYCELNGDSWLESELWVSDLHECDWGMPLDPCNEKEEFQIVRLLNNNMQGTLPPEISMISSLLELSIKNGTQIYGTIPSDYSILSELDTLDLSDNFLMGTLPVFIWRYEDLTLLSVGSNFFTGTIPDTIYLTEPNLRLLRLQKNKFSGTVPSTLSYLDWQELDLSDNAFTGTFPGEIDGTQLTELLLHNNALSGTFPVQTYTEEEYGVDTSLSKVTLYGNSFIGSIDGMCTLFDIGSLLLLEADLDQVICQCCSSPPPEDMLSDDDGVTGENDDDGDDSPSFQEVSFGMFNDLIADSPLTTVLDPYVRGDCDFSDRLQPHVISQCECDGSIRILSADILQVHDTLRTNFMQVIYGDDYDVPTTSCDPRNQALVWLASGDTRKAGDLLQRFIAATFYIAMNGTNWDVNDLWLSDQNECLWLGVTCDSSFQIYAIEFDNMNAFGKIPNELSLLSELRFFSLVRSGISGTIPSALFSLPNLEGLKLFSNRLSGAIPTSIGLASNLEVLELSTNFLSSTLPVELGLATSLRIIDVGGNDLTRTLPTELANLSLLSMLAVESNRISGTLQTEIGLWANMERFLATGTLMTGSIPREIGFMTNLVALQLADNGLSGTIPVQLRLLNRLERLELSSNRLSGTIPSEMRELTSLGELFLEENNLTGPIPQGICDLRNLRLQQFVVDCPTSDGTGVGIYEPEIPLQEVEGNCFTICRRA